MQPQDVDILITCCSIFCPTPSISSLIVNKFKMRQDIQTYHLGGMGCGVWWWCIVHALLTSFSQTGHCAQLHPAGSLAPLQGRQLPPTLPHTCAGTGVVGINLCRDLLKVSFAAVICSCLRCCSQFGSCLQDGRS